MVRQLLEDGLVVVANDTQTGGEQDSETVVGTLLESSAFGERWGVWRYPAQRIKTSQEKKN